MERREISRLGGLGNKGKAKSAEHRAHIAEAITKWWEQRRLQQQTPR